MLDSIYLFKVNNENNKILCHIYSKLTIKTSDKRQLTLFPLKSLEIR